MLSYEGIFFEQDIIELIHSLEKPMLSRINDEIHSTFKYHPNDDEIFNEIVGQSFEIWLIGYANDGENSGFEISFSNELKDYYLNYDEENTSILKIPHITASLSENAKSSNTKNLTFIPLEKPIKIIGKFGYWIKEENKEYLSYEPFYKNKEK